MRDALLQPRITRRSALQMAGAAVLPALIKPARAAEPSTLRVAFAIQPATLDPQKMRVGGVDYNYVYNCFSRLTAQDPQLQVQPDLVLRCSQMIQPLRRRPKRPAVIGPGRR